MFDSLQEMFQYKVSLRPGPPGVNGRVPRGERMPRFPFCVLRAPGSRFSVLAKRHWVSAYCALTLRIALGARDGALGPRALRLYTLLRSPAKPAAKLNSPHPPAKLNACQAHTAKSNEPHCRRAPFMPPIGAPIGAPKGCLVGPL